ncbi:hypothetical protein LTR85_007141 [Meristemomyces frigidus]|nr:hypothetical protein LTR85_007141 [Meristemomyces frigidus]
MSSGPPPFQDADHGSALESLSPTAIALLNALSHLDPDCITEDILLVATDDTGPSSFPHSNSGLHKAIAELTAAILIRRNATTGEIWIDCLVQNAARKRLRHDVLALQHSFDLAVHLLSRRRPFVAIGVVGRAHKVGRWTDGLQRSTPGFVESVDFALLLTEAGWYQYERGNVTEADPVLSLAETICESSSSDSRKVLSFIHGTRHALAATANDAGACLTHAQARVELDEALQRDTGIINAELASAYNDLGSAMARNKRYDEAMPLLEKSKALREALPGWKPYDNFSPVYHMGLVCRLQGYPAEASEHLLKALHDREAALGPMDKESRR